MPNLYLKKCHPKKKKESPICSNYVGLACRFKEASPFGFLTHLFIESVSHRMAMDQN